MTDSLYVLSTLQTRRHKQTLIHSLTHSLTHSSIHSLTHSLPLPLSSLSSSESGPLYSSSCSRRRRKGSIFPFMQRPFKEKTYFPLENLLLDFTAITKTKEKMREPKSESFFLLCFAFAFFLEHVQSSSTSLFPFNASSCPPPFLSYVIFYLIF